MRSLRELAQEAVAIQNACNACGLAGGLQRALSDLYGHAREQGHGTKWVNEHHITRLWVDKLASLAGLSTDLCSDSYHWCLDLIDERKVANE